jgi:hypothetical protein
MPAKFFTESHLKASKSRVTVVAQDNKSALEVIGLTFGDC